MSVVSPSAPRSWVLCCPYQSPGWSYYLAAVVDLSGPADDGSFASLDFPDARWEFMVFALDTMAQVPDPDDETTLRYLTPQNVRVQVPDHPLEKILAVLDAMAQAAVEGAVGVEPMFQRDLDPIWRYHIEGTLEHPYHHTEDK